jgi:ribosome-associated protein
MQPAIRAYYRLEEIWGEKEVKFGAAKRTSKHTASEDEAPKKVSRHLAASQTTADDEPKKPARKTAATKTSATKTAAKKAPAKKAVGKTIKVAATKTAEAYKKEKAPAKKTAAKKPAAKARAPAKPKAKSAE